MIERDESFEDLGYAPQLRMDYVTATWKGRSDELLYSILSMVTRICWGTNQIREGFIIGLKCQTKRHFGWT
ncbi:hypothetical protein EMCRGX_G002980 [Ephydatia muelleri]